MVDTSRVPNPRRLCVGLDPQRLAMLLAVMHRHAGLACFDQDVYLNAVGGVRVTETASDLALLAAVVSSMRNRPCQSAWWSLVRWVWPVKSGRRFVVRSDSVRPRDLGFPERLYRLPMPQEAHRRPGRHSSEEPVAGTRLPV